MDAFKIKHFERDNPGERYPVVTPLSPAEAARYSKRLASLLPRVYATSPLSDADANLDTFLLSEAWGLAGVAPADELLLSFDSLRSVDRMRRVDVEHYFADIWYPVSDNLLLFDASISWLMLIHHDGFIHTATDGTVDPTSTA